MGFYRNPHTATDLTCQCRLVTQMRGGGTIVSPEKITRRFSPLSSFERDLAIQGVSFETKVLSFDERATAPASILEHLGLSAQAVVGCLSLVRLVDDRIVCHDMRFYPPDIAKRIDARRAEREDCSKILEDVVGAQITKVHWDSEILPASPDMAKALGVVSRTLVFANFYTWYVEKGRPAESGVISYRVDRCKFRFEEEFRRNIVSSNLS